MISVITIVVYNLLKENKNMLLLSFPQVLGYLITVQIKAYYLFILYTVYHLFRLFTLFSSLPCFRLKHKWKNKEKPLCTFNGVLAGLQTRFRDWTWFPLSKSPKSVLFLRAISILQTTLSSDRGEIKSLELSRFFFFLFGTTCRAFIILIVPPILCFIQKEKPFTSVLETKWDSSRIRHNTP